MFSTILHSDISTAALDRQALEDLTGTCSLTGMQFRLAKCLEEKVQLNQCSELLHLSVEKNWEIDLLNVFCVSFIDLGIQKSLIGFMKWRLSISLELRNFEVSVL